MPVSLGSEAAESSVDADDCGSDRELDPTRGDDGVAVANPSRACGGGHAVRKRRSTWRGSENLDSIDDWQEERTAVGGVLFSVAPLGSATISCP